MTIRNKRSYHSVEWITGGVCGLLLTSGLAIGEYVQSRHVTTARPIERYSELHEQKPTAPATLTPTVRTVSFETVDWPDDLPKPMDLPRPLDISRFVDKPENERQNAPLHVAELPESGSIQR
ncbi:MAG: hypothetical protein WEA31_06465 [Pirellulales bacterium]